MIFHQLTLAYYFAINIPANNIILIPSNYSELYISNELYSLTKCILVPGK